MLNSVSEQFAEFFIFLRWQENTRAQHPKLLILKTVKEDVGTRIRLPLKHSPNVCQLWVSRPSCPVWRKKGLGSARSLKLVMQEAAAASAQEQSTTYSCPRAE